MTEATAPFVAVVGGGPAGLMAAEVVASGGGRVVVYDHMAAVGRKFLLAGRSGLNLTHTEPLERFLDRYGTARARLEPAQHVFLRVFRGEHQNRELIAFLTERRAHREAVELRQHHVEQRQIRRVLARERKRFASVDSRAHAIATKHQHVQETLANAGLVLHHQDMSRARSGRGHHEPVYPKA